MKVWIVEGNDYEDQAVRAVFTTEALAKEYLRKQPYSSYLTVTDYDVLDALPNQSTE